MTYPNAVFSAFAFTGFVLSIIPFSWHFQARNTGTCLYMFWTGLACLNQFINSVVWNGNAYNLAPRWCDLSAQIIIAYSYAVPVASLCINRRLYYISCVRVVSPTKSDKLREIMVDLTIGFGIPALGMILCYIPQGHRFDIYEDIGCYPFLYYVWPFIVIAYVLPILIGLVSGTYAVLTITAFLKNRSRFNVLRTSHNNIPSNRFIRLMCLAGLEVLFNVPLCIFLIAYSLKTQPLNPWISWANVHSHFNRVDQFPNLIWRANPYHSVTLEFGRWINIFCAFAFFAFFGFADEARKNYRSAFQTVAKTVGISTTSFGSGGKTTTFFGSTGMISKANGSSGKVRPTIPLFVHKETLQRFNSMDSFTNMSMSTADVSGALNEKSDAEKGDFCPTLSYGAISIVDVGGALAETKDDILSIPQTTSPASSSTSSITYPTPVLASQNSRDGIEISTVYRGSSYVDTTNSSVAVPTSNTSSPSQATGQNMV